MKTYQLRCIAPDGAIVREGEFPSIQAAWDRASDMGSRWFFYPVCVVTGASRSDRARVLDCPEGLKEYAQGRTLKSVCAMFARNSEAVCEWVNGKAPLILEN